MRALAFDFTWDESLEPAPKPERRLYAVRGTVDAPAEPAPLFGPDAASSVPRLDLITGGAWEALAGDSSTACLMCGGEMTPRWSAGAGVTGGRCGDCGTSLD